MLRGNYGKQVWEEVPLRQAVKTHRELPLWFLTDLQFPDIQEMLRGSYGKQEPVVDSNFRTYHFKRMKYSFFANTDARHWSFKRFYSFNINSGDAPKTFNEILDKWTASLKFIQGQKYIPKAIKKFVEELINFNETKKFENLLDAYEQNFQAHFLATLSSGSVTKIEMAKSYMKQTDEILNSKLGMQNEEYEEDSYVEDDAMSKNSNLVYSDDEFTEESPTYEKNLKRKLEDDDLPGYDGLIFLFNDSNEDKIMEKIDENTLEEERKLPLASDNKDPSTSICDEVLSAFQKYQNKIPKIRRVYTPAYWGVLDLTRESLYGCKEVTENDLQQLSQDFADHIKWKCELTSKDIQDYFDGNCVKLDNSDENKDLKHFDSNVQFLKNNMHFFQEMLTEEHLKMISSYPLFHGTFMSNRIKHSWGEIHALSSSDARNEKSDPLKKARVGRKVDMKVTLLKTPNKFEALFGEVSGGLGQFGIPTACRKKRFLDKVKLMVTMRDSVNRLLKERDHVSNEKRLEIIVFGWLQFGLELNFYAMDWMGSGIYRFGLIDRCRIPADIDDCDILEDAYCILKLLQRKLLDTERNVRNLFSNNTKGKRRQIALENKAELNVNRSP
ncbi:11798_t:CDS:2 [Ambispora leptoticha]|uniref:11798_t:CDS:1 n=1 Tax=Ambispora leptoticha TaxID=144679 RepID=A0A9N9F5I8_9GLOM|nr:11798_t:CDS:2 [Ambispora leptoticha]